MAKKKIIFKTPFETYTSTGLIGEGGSGRVHSVENSEGNLYALKCLAPDRVTNERKKRFKNEIEFCQRNSHPNIVRVIDTGFYEINDTRCPFYVMENYSGTLRTRMGNLNPEEILRLFSQILDGVEAAHLKGVWHRDLKPENLLWDSDKNILVVADFGIAYFEEEEIFTAVETRIASRMANFQYSAPEQRIRNSNVDHRADIFALGLILNEMFTNQILQGAGYTKISEINGDYAYLDDLVDLMTQQNMENRSDSIEIIKKELIARKNAFVSLQKYDEVKSQVVKASEPREFEPISILGFDYLNDRLVFQLSRNAPLDWAQMFKNPGSHGSLMGFGPETYSINGDKAVSRSLGLHSKNKETIQKLVNFAKQYVEAANNNYELSIRSEAIQKEQAQREELERRVNEEKLRHDIISTVKL